MTGSLLARLSHALAGGRLLRFAGAMASRGMEAAGKFGLYMLAARLMGGAESGLFFLCLVWVNLASTAARMGLERAASRHVAAELAISDRAAAKRAMAVTIGATVAASLLAGGATALLAQPVALHIFRLPELAAPLALSGVILLPQSLAIALGFCLIGLDRAVTGQLVQSGLPPVLSLLALVAGYTQLNTVLCVYALSYAVCCVLGAGALAWAWAGDMPARNPDAAPAEALPSIWTTARPFLVIELVQSLLLSVPVLVLGAFAPPAQVSAFSIVFRMTMLINTMLVSIALIAAPGFAAHHRRGEFAQLRHLDRQTRLVAMAVGLPAIAAMAVLTGPFLDLMSSNIPGAAPTLWILLVSQVVNTALPTQDMMLSMTGQGGILLRMNLWQLLGCCALSAVLIPPFAMIGAAVVCTLILIQGRVSFALAVRRVLPELRTA